MTKAEWYALEPAEANALVEVEVFGGARTTPLNAPFDYLHSWDAMREVVERAVSLGYVVEFVADTFEDGSLAGYGATAWGDRRPRMFSGGWVHHDNSLPLAVCPAILMALGVVE